MWPTEIVSTTEPLLMIFAMFTSFWLAIMGRSWRERKLRTPSHPKYKKD